MIIPFVDLTAQYNSIKPEIDQVIDEVIKSNSFIQGNFVSSFENSFSKAIGVNHCIGTGNGTDAISISLKALGIGLGDEVIVPANSFIATSEAVSWIGAKAVFVDNKADTYNIDANLLQEKINSRTKAIIVVHLYGQIAEMDEILAIAKENDLYIVEDSAQAHLAEYNSNSNGWKMAGSFGDIATFSFYPGKNLGAYGDAGAVVTNNEKYARRVRMLANHGRISKYNHEFEGINSRMDGIQGAILQVKLKYLTYWTNKRREVAKYYLNNLNDVKEIMLPIVRQNQNPAWHLFVIRVKNRNDLRKYLIDNGISSGIHYPIALPFLEAYAKHGYNESDFPIAHRYQNELLSLPIFPEIKRDELDFVIHMIRSFYKKQDDRS